MTCSLAVVVTWEYMYPFLSNTGTFKEVKAPLNWGRKTSISSPSLMMGNILLLIVTFWETAGCAFLGVISVEEGPPLDEVKEEEH